ncbi:TPA: SGNH/GDSL hydrolase family protein [Candidatus Poribacteria bacterium]|nr:SGNH/GDSL hydrolase family protein [Candidatus Poribacteria bacterium]
MRKSLRVDNFSVDFKIEKRFNDMKPFWISEVMESESLFFVQKDENELPNDTLLFIPDKILSVKSASRDILYNEGKDYIINQEGIISLPKGSRIPFKTAEEMRPAPNSPNSIPACRDGKSHLLFGEGHFFHDMQIEISYTHKETWKAPIPEFALNDLPKTKDKLINKLSLKVVLFGDSISAGGNASGFTGAKPFMPPYGDLVVHGLQEYYGSEITYKNYSVGGTASEWGLQNISVVAEENPDLVIIAFGMNDASGRVTPEQFKTNIYRQMKAVKEKNPNAEFILVATMTANPEWTASSPDLYPIYRDMLKTLCSDGVILADMTSMWTELLKRKSYASLTGNGVNHPNDFGHRIYAQVILALLVPSFL